METTSQTDHSEVTGIITVTCIFSQLVMLFSLVLFCSFISHPMTCLLQIDMLVTSVTGQWRLVCGDVVKDRLVVTRFHTAPFYPVPAVNNVSPSSDISRCHQPPVLQVRCRRQLQAISCFVCSHTWSVCCVQYRTSLDDVISHRGQGSGVSLNVKGQFIRSHTMILGFFTNMKIEADTFI